MNLNQLLMSTLMGQLKNKNPQGYNEIQSLMNSGKSPEIVLNDLLSSGRFTEQDVQNVKNYLNQNGNRNIKRF